MAAPSSRERLTPAYRERLTAPWSLRALTVAFCASFGLALLPVLGPTAAAVAALALSAIALAGLAATSATVEVREGRLRAGRAEIAVALLGEPVPLDPERARLLRGPEIDPAAYHLIRGWVGTAVVVDVMDARDPTPYWYVATRHPESLAAALTRAQRGGSG